VTKLDDLWIDIGAKDAKQAQAAVEIGDPAAIAYDLTELLNGRYVSRAMDDKIGAFVVLEAARLLAKTRLAAEVIAVATVQEEIGLRGATTSAFALDPQVGIAVDVNFATDFPSMEGEKKRLGVIKLGCGPTLTRGPNVNPVLFDLLVATAKKHKLPHQIVADPRGTGTDANEIQLTRAGVATALVSVPNRYMHSPSEMVSLDDVVSAAKLIAAPSAGSPPRPTLRSLRPPRVWRRRGLDKEGQFSRLLFMKTLPIGAFEAKTHLSALLEKCSGGRCSASRNTVGRWPSCDRRRARRVALYSAATAGG